MALAVVLRIVLPLFTPDAFRANPRWVLVVLLLVDVLFATGRLIHELVTGASETTAASSLLISGAIIWVGNAVVFSLLYWELDSGGPAQRAHVAPRYPDFAFPEQLNPEIAPPRWRATYIDYLYLGFTNATAFSPTDVMPLAHWAKLTMIVQSLISLTVLGLVIARAVSILN